MSPAAGEGGGARKFCPTGWKERESPPPAQRLSSGAPPPGRRTNSAHSSPPPPTAAVSSGGELRRLLPGAADPDWKLQARGEGASVPGAGRRWLLAPSPEWLVDGSSRGAVSSSPPRVPLRAASSPRDEGQRVQCHPVPGSNLAEVAASLEGRGREGVITEREPSPLRSVGCSAGGGWICTTTASRTHESRGEERSHAGSRCPGARPAPGPPRLAAFTLAAGRSCGA